MRNLTAEELRIDLRELGACSGAIKWAKDKSLAEAWENCDRPDWMLWYYGRHTPDKMVYIEIAIFAAEQVIGIYEKKHPDDNRPRKAIEAAREYLRNPSEETIKTARAARSAAYAAASPADAARYAAYAAADAAADAAYAAAYAAASAAYAADSAYAATDAAYAAAYAAYAADSTYAATEENRIKICDFIQAKIKIDPL